MENCCQAQSTEQSAFSASGTAPSYVATDDNSSTATIATVAQPQMTIVSQPPMATVAQPPVVSHFPVAGPGWLHTVEYPQVSGYQQVSGYLQQSGYMQQPGLLQLGQPQIPGTLQLQSSLDMHQRSGLHHFHLQMVHGGMAKLFKIYFIFN